MSDTDFAKEGLSRLHDQMAWHVESGQMPGLISLVARNGESHIDVVGTPSFEDASVPVGGSVWRRRPLATR